MEEAYGHHQLFSRPRPTGFDYEKVCDDHEPVIITRQKEDSVVMISLADFKALEETSCLLRVPKNARRLLESLAELEKGGGTERTLDT